MRYLFLHAHPDDETLATGAILLGLHREGDEAYVLTACRGEQGEVVPGRWTGRPGTPEFTERRMAELAKAVAALHVSGQCFLGTPPARAEGLKPRVYEDSGMRWVTPTLAGPAADVGPDAFTRADLDEVIGDIRAYAESIGAEAVVSYADDGGYGHPDHVRCHKAAKRAASELHVPFLTIVTDPAARAPRDRWFDAEGDITDLVAAHRAHATQFTVSGRDIVHVGGQHQDMVVQAGIRRG